MKKLFILSLALFCVQFVFSQTLVNQTLYSTFDRPNQQLEYIKAIPVGGNCVAVLDNNYSSLSGSDYESMHVAKFSLDSGLVGGMDLYFQHGRDFGTNLYSKNGKLYVTGFTTDSIFSHSYQCNLAVIDIASFDTIFTTAVQIDSAVNQMPFGVAADDSGNIYMGAAVSTPTSYKISLLKLNSSGTPIWQSDYDSTGYYTIPVAMNVVEDITGTYFSVTGFSFDNGGHSHFVTISVDPSNGHLKAGSYSANGTGAISHPVGIVSDTTKNSYVAGTSTVAGLTSVIKLVKYDSLFNELWTVTWGDSSKTNTASFMGKDEPFTNGHIFVTGSSPNANGGTDIVTLKYNPDGSLAWERRLPASDPTRASNGICMTADLLGDVYVTGTTYNGLDTDIVTAAYDTAGTLLWSKTYGRKFGSNDVPYSMLLDDNGYDPIVFGRSIGTDSVYMALKYEQTKTELPSDTLPPVEQWAYYENIGQLVDTGSHQADYLHFYTNTSNPRVYLADNMLSYVFDRGDTTGDTIQRIDLVFHQAESSGGKPVNSSPSFFGSEQIRPYLNYYIGGLPSYYENVQGYQRITEKDLYTGIDWQLYSDAGGPKYYYEITPYTDPANIEFEYQGADSTYVDSTGITLESRFGTMHSYVSAYQGPTPVAITVNALGSNYYTFSLGSYDISQALTIVVGQNPPPAQTLANGNLEWATKFGGTSGDHFNGICGDQYGSEFTLGMSNSIDIPVTTGLTTYPSGSLYNNTIEQFNQTDHLVWCSYYGMANSSMDYMPSGYNLGHRIMVESEDPDAPEEPLYILVNPANNSNTASNLPAILPLSNFSSTNHLTTLPTSGSQGHIILARFDGHTGQLKYGTLLTSDMNYANCLAINNKSVFVGGGTNASTPSLINTTSSWQDAAGKGMILQFDNDMNLVWSTGFGSTTTTVSHGGGEDDQIADMTFDNTGALIITGTTSNSFSYSVTQPSGAYTQSFLCVNQFGAMSYESGYIAKFTPSSITGSSLLQYNLNYYTLFGGTYPAWLLAIATDNNNNIYVGGNVFGSDAGLPLHSGSSSSSNSNVIAKFNSNFSLQWINLFGEGNIGGYLQSIACDAYNDVFAAGTIDQFAVSAAVVKSGWYNQSVNSNGKLFLSEFDASGLEQWFTFYGSGYDDFGAYLSINGNNLYLAEDRAQDNGSSIFPYQMSPYANAYYYSTAANFGTISRFDISSSPTGLISPKVSVSDIVVYPNPAKNSFSILIPNNCVNDAVYVNLFNCLGEKVEGLTSEEQMINVNCASLPNGIYIVQVSTPNQKYSSRISIIGK